MLDFIKVEMTKEQYAAANMVHRILGKVLVQAAPTDETPLVIHGSELLQVAGEELLNGFQG